MVRFGMSNRILFESANIFFRNPDNPVFSYPCGLYVKKEFRQFFSSLTGYIAIAVFLLLNGLFLFVFPDSNLLDFGYATLSKFFELAPWILLLLVPAITMRSFSEEFKSGTFEILQTRPLHRWQVVMGKYMGALLVVCLALVPTLIYLYVFNSFLLRVVSIPGVQSVHI